MRSCGHSDTVTPGQSAKGKNRTILSIAVRFMRLRCGRTDMCGEVADRGARGALQTERQAGPLHALNAWGANQKALQDGPHHGFLNVADVQEADQEALQDERQTKMPMETSAASVLASVRTVHVCAKYCLHAATKKGAAWGECRSAGMQQRSRLQHVAE